MEFRKADAEAKIQEFLPLCPAAMLENGQLNYGHTVWILNECEGQQKYFDEMAAQGLNYKILVGDIKKEIEKLKAQTQWYEDDYQRRYPQQGHTTKEVIHLNITTGERTPEERSTIPDRTERDWMRFKNTVLIAFLDRIKKDFAKRARKGELLTREEELAQEARATRIIQAAQEKAEADLHIWINEDLPEELALHPKAEHTKYASQKAQQLRNEKDANAKAKPWLKDPAKHLAKTLITWEKVRKMPDSWFVSQIAGWITTTQYIKHLAALADEREPAKKPGRKSKEFSLGPEVVERIRQALRKKGLLSERGTFTGNTTQAKALYNVLVSKGIIDPSSDEQFSHFLKNEFGFSITGRTLRNQHNKGQKEEEKDFRALF